jgi:hypothetical protein
VHGLSAAVIVEPDPGVEALIKENPDLFKRWIFSSGAAIIERDNARSHFARGSADYDLIVYPAGINLASAAAGLTGTAESYEITLQGIEAALANLKKTGMIAITGWNRFPPTGRWKLLALLGRIKALDEGKGFSGRVYLVEGWSNYTILVRREPFTDNQLKILSDFCSRRGFNLIDSDRFPAPDERLPSREKALVDYLDLRPPVDSRPYPWHSLRLSYLEKLTGGSRESAFPRVEWGFFFLTMVLAVNHFSPRSPYPVAAARGDSGRALFWPLFRVPGYRLYDDGDPSHKKGRSRHGSPGCDRRGAPFFLHARFRPGQSRCRQADEPGPPTRVGLSRSGGAHGRSILPDAIFFEADDTGKIPGPVPDGCSPRIPYGLSLPFCPHAL